MKRASDILLKISYIFGLVMGILLLVSFVPTICIAFLPEAREAFIQVLENNGADFGDDPEAIALIVQLSIVCYSLVFVFLGTLCIVDAVISKKALNEPSKNRYIACIILGAMSVEFSLIGGILGLVALNRENNRKQQE